MSKVEQLQTEILDLKLKRQTAEIKLKIQKLQQQLDELVDQK